MTKLERLFLGVVISPWIATIILLLIIGIVAVCSGCSTLQGNNTIGVIPTAGEQLWKAAKSSNWLVTLSIVGIAASVFATLNGSKTGIAGIAACSVSLFMALAVARFAWWMALFGMVGSTGLVAASILARKKALVEIIKGVQNVKKSILQPMERTDLTNGYLEQVQSKPTKKIVQGIKTDLKLKGEI